MQMFIVEPLFSDIGVRRYSIPRQQYDLADACLTHMAMCIRHMQEASAAGDVHETSGLLGAWVMSQLLSQQGQLLKEVIVHVLDAGGPSQPAAVDRLVLLRQRGHTGIAAEKVRCVTTAQDPFNKHYFVGLNVWKGYVNKATYVSSSMSKFFQASGLVTEIDVIELRYVPRSCSTTIITHEQGPKLVSFLRNEHCLVRSADAGNGVRFGTVERSL